MLGFAWQRGLVPVSAESLEQAIELNAVAVEFNKQAFLWGRRCADQPEKVMQIVATDEAEKAVPTLQNTIDDRKERLTEYQNAAYGQSYVDEVERVKSIDPNPEQEGSLTWLAAQNLHKLMAYKDEYEVGRLYSDGEFLRKLEQQFEGGYELRFNMAPPLFSKRDPNTGHLIKREFGPWMMKAFALLSKFRVLRGTALDVFGYSLERKQERADIVDYRELLSTLIEGLNDGNYAVAQELAGLSSKLRGFGHVKDRNREQMDVRQGLLLAKFRGETGIEAVNIVEAA